MKRRLPDDYKRVDIAATRSIRQWYDYLKKEDPDVYEHINMEAVNKRKAWIDQKLADIQLKINAPRWTNVHCTPPAEDVINISEILSCKGCDEVCIGCEPLWRAYWSKL